MASINLWVDSCTDEHTTFVWGKIAFTPWLHDYIGAKRYSSLVDADTFWYSFESVGADSVSSVILYMEV